MKIDNMAYLPGWLYIVKEKLNIKDLSDSLTGYDYEVWPDAGFLEIMSGENDTWTGKSLDVEEIDLDTLDEITGTFVIANQGRAAFLITYEKEIHEQAVSVMKKFLEIHGGLICGDTEDLTPVIR